MYHYMYIYTYIYICICIYPHIKRSHPSSTFSWTLIFCSAAGVTRSTRPMAKSICVAKLVTTEVNSYDAVCEKRGTYMTYIWKIYGRCAKIMKDMEDRWKNRWEKLRTQPSLVISIRLCYEFYSPRSLLDFRLKFRDDHQNPPNPVEYICIQVPLSRGSEKEDKVRGYTWHNRRHSFVQTSGCSLN